MRARALTLAAVALAASCSGGSGGSGSGGGGAGDAEADRLFQEGQSWVQRAETAPLPTPDAAAGGTVPEFKQEELRALESFEKAIAARADHAPSQLALADLLAPHAIARAQRERQARAEQEAAARRPRRGRPTPTPVPVATPVSLVNASVDRVLDHYRAAVQADPSRAPVDKLIAFATQVGRLDVAEEGHQELLKRVKESAEPYALYGDFLAVHANDRDRAIEQYRQALIWKADDETVRGKLVDIHLARAIESYNKQEFARAAVELKEAQKYVTDRSSDRGRRVQAYVDRMREIRR